MSANLSTQKLNITKRKIEYPSSDGKPMAETDVHCQTIFDIRFALTYRYSNDDDVYVATDLLIYYIEGNPHKRVAPDVFVVFGVGKHQRRSYKLWEEKQVPSVVFEISSRETCLEDLNRKFRLYEELGVKEYFIFDPEYDYLEKPLVGFRLKNKKYVEIKVKNGILKSEVLGLELVDTGKGLRLRDPKTNKFLPTTQETIESQRKLEDENARLRQELARLKRK